MKTLHNTSIRGGVLSGVLLLLMATVIRSGTIQAHERLPYATIQQQITVSGIVQDQEDGQPLSGVSITSGNRVLSATKANGRFDVTVPAGSALTFSLIGFNPRAVTVSEAQANLVVELSSSTTEIDEVVVTALGIEREAKSLGYSISTIDGDELTQAISNNWSDALTGKVAGLNLVKSGAGPAGSTQIILRGETSLTDNNALIVVDGVVISNSSGRLTGEGSGNYLSGDSPVDFGSSLADINPDDIESVSVLKGPGASALYGYRGANGAIIITTKSGRSGQKGLGITFNSNTSIATINRWPDYQNEYGQGVRESGGLYYSYGQSEDGASTLSTSSAWGPRFNGQMYYQYNPDYHRMTPPERTLWRPYKNNQRDFFQPSVTLTNNLSMSGGNDKTTARLSYTNAFNEWIIPEMGYSRHSIALQVNHKIFEKLSISAKVNYNNKSSDNLPNSGYNNQSYMYFIRGLTPNMNPEWFKGGWLPGKEGIDQLKPFSNLLDNPHVMSYDMINSMRRNGVIGNVQVDYRFNDLFSIMVRGSTDFQYDARRQVRPFGTNKFNYGYLSEMNIFTQETNADFLVRYDNSRRDTWKHSISIGGSMMDNQYTRDWLSTSRLVTPNTYNFANTAENLAYRPYKSRFAVNSLYSLAMLSYKDFLYFDGSVRIDWASTLASVERGEVTPFFYPSLNASFVLSDAFELPAAINFWKLRASAAAVGGGGTRPYLNSYTYNPVANFGSGLENPTTIPNPNLRYELTTSYELGTNMHLIKNRLQFDVTVYQSNTRDQILSTPIDPSSGYRFQVINGGNVRNTGIEIAANGSPIRRKSGFSWKIYGNFTAFDTEVVSLADSVDKIVISTIYGSRGTVEARVGGRMGDLYGFGYKRAPSGEILYSNGLPQTSDELVYLGNANANVRFGFGNEFSYKNFSFNILFDGQYGGTGFSLTHAVLMEEGKLQKSVPGRMSGIIGNGVVANGDGTYSPNTTVAEAGAYYYAHFNRDNLEANTFSTDFIKLRELRLDYKLPTIVVNKWRLQQAVIGIYGRDLLVFSHWPAFDPEFASLTNGSIEKGAEVAQFPSTRTFGLNLKMSF
ncbi:SusC/RagA family TonB-linked outer membrane protein [Parapedobacter deserti]|uniref:SusC/RagA family TonB-linked outer membrane protein n=1 Tax=Parapedobacter deserti TaxID=1912957 RepID=A0ABV7JNS3_9SPHI